jgi:hypothetical protein
MNRIQWTLRLDFTFLTTLLVAKICAVFGGWAWSVGGMVTQGKQDILRS